MKFIGEDEKKKHNIDNIWGGGGDDTRNLCREGQYLTNIHKIKKMSILCDKFAL